MPANNEDLHGNAPDTCAVALLLIDVINDLEYPGGDTLLAQALPAARAIATLRRRAKRLHIPTIYVNDNFGKWQSDQHDLVNHCLNDGVRGAPIVRLLAPDADDYFVLKPKHSGFYSTTLDVLLDYLHAQTLILTGFAGDVCVLLTASDAFLRDFQLFIPTDCVASIDPAENEHALRYAERVLKVETRPSIDLDLDRLITNRAEETDW